MIINFCDDFNNYHWHHTDTLMNVRKHFAIPYTFLFTHKKTLSNALLRQNNGPEQGWNRKNIAFLLGVVIKIYISNVL